MAATTKKPIPEAWNRRLRQIESLDPAVDFEEITRLFLLDFQNVLIAQAASGNLFTFSVPRMSRILVATGEFTERTEKRVVDTVLLTQAVSEHGFGPGPGQAAAKRVNGMHRKYDIHKDDFVGVGCDIAVSMVEFANRFGWRDVTDAERKSLAAFHGRAARVFGSHQPLPDSIGEMWTYWNAYLDEQARFEPQNRVLTKAFLRYLPTMFPRGMGRIGTSLILAQVDARILAACGLKEPSRLRRALSDLLLTRIGATGPGPDPIPGEDGAMDKLARRVYPHGWSMDTIGSHIAQGRVPNPSSSHTGSSGCPVGAANTQSAAPANEEDSA